MVEPHRSVLAIAFPNLTERLLAGQPLARQVFRRAATVTTANRIRSPSAALYLERCQDLPSVAAEGAWTISTCCMSEIVRAPSAAID